MTEVIRQKFFYILVIFGIVVLSSSRFFSQFSSVEQIKFIKDFSLAAITVFGALIAIVGTAQLLPLELENRTIYPVLAKPVFRAEFLLGKYLGMATLLLLTVILMAVIFGGLLFYTERQLTESVLQGATHATEVSPQETVGQIFKQTRDPNLLKAVTLIYFKVAMVSAISMFISTFASSVIFNVIATAMIYICGHLEGTARQAWLGGQKLMEGGQAAASKITLLIITSLVPDLNAFNIADAVVIGQIVPWAYVIQTVSYGFFYSAIALWIAYMIFQEREI